MATVQISLGEYLKTSYQPDCDYVEGETEERIVGEQEHSVSQGFVIQWIGGHGKEWNLRALPEIRIRVAAERVRIADVAIVRRDEPYEPVLTRPPLVVVEVLSPEDRINRYQQRLEDYRAMGVPGIWVIDPERRGAFDCSDGAWRPAVDLCIPGRDYHLQIRDLWAELDSLRS
jgi:hypothetical protein